MQAVSSAPRFQLGSLGKNLLFRSMNSIIDLIFLNDVLTQRQRYEDSDADYNHHYIYNTNTFELTT